MQISVSYYLLPTILVLIAIRKYKVYCWGKCKNKVKLSKKIVIVTGANTGIGYELTKELAEREAHVIMACRNSSATADAITKIKKELPNAVLIPMELDLASLKSVKKFADEIEVNYSEIHILVNNAGVYYPDNVVEKTSDGFEVHFGVNHLGHFYLTNLLLDILKATKDSRILIVSSMLHKNGKIYLKDLTMECFSNIKGYASSKLANVYFSQELAKRLQGTNVNTYALCPGWVNTNIFRQFNYNWIMLIFMIPAAFFFMRTLHQGVQTSLYCATEPQLDYESGLMYRDCKKYKPRVTIDPEISLKLWDLSENLIKGVMS